MSEEARIATMSTAQAILTAAWRMPVQLIMADQLDDGESHSLVQRLQVTDGPADAPQFVIVKRVDSDDSEGIFDPDDNESFTMQRFVNEWAGLQFLSEVFDGNPPSHHLYGADRTSGIMVLEDLGHGSTLVEPLLGDTPALAEAGLIELMTTLGQIHAHTIGKEEAYTRIRQAIGVSPKPPYFSSAAEGVLLPARLAELCYAVLDTLGLSAAPGLDADLAAVTHFWADPGPFRAYTHGDAAPGNEFKVGGQRKLIDFEYGGFGHALAEGITARIHFVTGFHVQRMPDAVALAMENAYRTELVQGCPEASDDRRFYRGITEACAYATIAMWDWAMPDILTEDEEWGLSSGRQRILHRLEILAETTTTFGHLQVLGEMASKIRAELCRRWPSEVQNMPYYPAFRSSNQHE